MNFYMENNGYDVIEPRTIGCNELFHTFIVFRYFEFSGIFRNNDLKDEYARILGHDGF